MNNNKKYLGNAFSLQMLPDFNTGETVNVEISEVSEAEAKTGTESIVGHADTAAVLNVPYNRVSVKLNHGDVLYVAQLQGGRLPEGSTTLPEGFTFKFLKVVIA